MATTLSEDAYNDLMAKVDNYDYALRRIASWFEDGDPHDYLGALDSIRLEIDELKEEGYLA